MAGVRATPGAVAGTRDGSAGTSDCAAGEVAIDLRVTPAKPIVLQGDRGLSRKSAEPGNASYYYSIPRLATEGTITIGGKAARVRGTSWLDREWSTSALGPDQVGWDWFALQLDDGHELMFYQLRRADGSADPFSAGVWIDSAGRATRLTAQDVTVEVLDRWNSPRGGIYPARWRLTVPSARLSLEVTPVLADQELDVSVRYWEGAVDVTGTRAGRTAAGVGYVELTGYAGTSLERARRTPR
jgi:predicted secreted hydrolase